MSTGTEPVIRVRGLTRRFDGVIAVEHLTMDVRPGEVFGFLGHNGAGKTTTVRLLNGVLGPSGGTDRVPGLDPVMGTPVPSHRHPHGEPFSRWQPGC